MWSKTRWWPFKGFAELVWKIPNWSWTVAVLKGYQERSGPSSLKVWEEIGQPNLEYFPGYLVLPELIWSLMIQVYTVSHRLKAPSNHPILMYKSILHIHVPMSHFILFWWTHFPKPHEALVKTYLVHILHQNSFKTFSQIFWIPNYFCFFVHSMVISPMLRAVLFLESFAFFLVSLLNCPTQNPDISHASVQELLSILPYYQHCRQPLIRLRCNNIAMKMVHRFPETLVWPLMLIQEPRYTNSSNLFWQCEMTSSEFILLLSSCIMSVSPILPTQ